MNTQNNISNTNAGTHDNSAAHVHTSVKAGGWVNHNEEMADHHYLTGIEENDSQTPHLHVKSEVKAGGWLNHNEAEVHVRSAIKAGGWDNHNERGMRVRSAIKAGGWDNHSESLRMRSC